MSIHGWDGRMAPKEKEKEKHEVEWKVSLEDDSIRCVGSPTPISTCVL